MFSWERERKKNITYSTRLFFLGTHQNVFTSNQGESQRKKRKHKNVLLFGTQCPSVERSQRSTGFKFFYPPFIFISFFIRFLFCIFVRFLIRFCPFILPYVFVLYFFFLSVTSHFRFLFYFIYEYFIFGLFILPFSFLRRILLFS